MPTDKPTDKPAKANRLAAHEAAVRTAEESAANLKALEEQFLSAKAKHLVDSQAAESLHQEAFAEEIAEHAKTCSDNEHRHHNENKRHCDDIAKRKAAREKRGETPTPHDEIGVFTVDGWTHEVVSAHELMLGTRGFNGGSKPAPGSRYIAGCNMSVDARHDELDHERFDQTKDPNCPACIDAVTKMDAGEIPSKRGDYLSSKEHLAHVRKKNADRNKASNERGRA